MFILYVTRGQDGIKLVCRFNLCYYTNVCVTSSRFCTILQQINIPEYIVYLIQLHYVAVASSDRFKQSRIKEQKKEGENALNIKVEIDYNYNMIFNQ